MDYSREDTVAMNTIRDGCINIMVDGVPWYDTEWLHFCSSVQWEVKYLRMRGLLTHHPLIPKLIRLKGDK